MIVKESISTDDEGILYDVGTQKMTLRPQTWYRDFIIMHGFDIIQSKFHDRS